MAMQAIINTGREIMPGDHVVVQTNPVRMWGARIRTDPAGHKVDVDGTVMSLTFEKDQQTNELVWYGEAYVRIPIDGTESVYDTFVKITKENCKE